MKKNMLLAALLFTFAAYSQMPSSGLILYYPFNGNANDASGNGNNGIVNGPLLTVDRFGNAKSAYLFDGIDDYIMANNSCSLQSPTNQVTISAWVLTLGDSYRYYIVDKRNNMSDYPYSSYVLLSSRDTVKTWQFTVSPAPFIVDRTLTTNSTTSIIKDTWYHVAGVYDSTVMKIYINGILEDIDSVSGPIIYSDLPLYFGTAANVSGHFMNGVIDDVRIYNRALDSTEISNLYYKSSCFETIYDTISKPNCLWHQNGDDLYFNDGKVGIGKINNGGYFNPKLLVADGWLQVTESNEKDAGIVVSHSNKYSYGFARTLHMVHEGVNGDPFTEFRIRNTDDNNTITSWSIGADNSDNDKLVITNALETSLGASPSVGKNLLTIKTTGQIGIGTKEPQNALSIVGDETEWPGRVMLSVNNISTSPKSLAYMELKAGPSGNHLVLGHISETYSANSAPADLQDYGLVSSNGNGIIIGALKNDLSAGIIKFCNGQNEDNSFIETMRIAKNGNVGIGTKEPNAKLHIADGDIYISDINKGIIMKSPDNQCWRGILNNEGSLTFSPVTCPEIESGDTLSENSVRVNKNNSINIFPNPSGNNLYVGVTDNKLVAILKIYTINGLLTKTVALKSDFSNIDLSDLVTGTYILKFIDKDGTIIKSEKLIKE